MMKKGFTPDEFSKQEILNAMDEEERKFQIITSLTIDEKSDYETLLNELKRLGSSIES